MKKKNSKILIVDDNEEILFSLEVILSEYFERIVTLKSPKQIPSILNTEKFDVYILDMNFTANINSGNEGLFWMREILNRDPNASIIFITAFAGIELAVKAIKDGATDFIEKPWDNRKIIQTILNAYELRKSKNRIKELELKQKEIIGIQSQNPNIIRFTSPIMSKVYETIDKAAPTDANILILGENGTGKEFIAKDIHNQSERRDNIFVHVDMGALNENLIESELFGHIKGSYTDAKEDRIGRFEIADGGTLFLDEIGNLPMHLQSKLLSAIQNRRVTRIGSNQSKEVDIRLICATNQPLYEMVYEGRFREDLLYRINTIQIELPPLRLRKMDIEHLSQHFIELYSAKYRKQKIKLSESALKHLTEYSWPGNIRQLQHTIESTVILCNKPVISQQDINLKPTKNEGRRTDDDNFYENEKEHIRLILQKHDGNLSKVSEILGIARTTLYRKMKKYDL